MPDQTHSVRLSLASPEQTFSLGPTSLDVSAAGASSNIPYADIQEIGLITYGGYGGLQGQATLRTRAGKKIKIRSHHYRGLGDFENRSTTYRPFMQGLLQHVHAANPNARFVSGSTIMTVVWWVLLVCFVLMFILLGLALLSGKNWNWSVLGSFVAALVLIPFAWRSARRSRQAEFDPGMPPAEALSL